MACFAATMAKIRAFVALVRTKKFPGKTPLFIVLRWWRHLVKAAPHFAKLTCDQRVSQSLRVCIRLQCVSGREQKIEPANNLLLRVPHKKSYGQQNEV